MRKVDVSDKEAKCCEGGGGKKDLEDSDSSDGGGGGCSDASDCKGVVLVMVLMIGR